MASSVATNLPAAAGVPPSPVVAVSTAAATPEPAISKDFIDFEFSLGGSATMLPADELFADGKLLPLRKPLPDPEDPAPAASAEEAVAMPPAQPEPIKPLRAAAADSADPCVFSPKAPSCSSRWRELLGLKRAAEQSPEPSPPAARAANSAAARSLKLLLQRNTAGRSSASDLSSAPLLRDSSDSEASLSLASSRFSLSSSSSSSTTHDHDDVPRLSLDSAADPNPPRIRLVRSSQHHHHRHSTTTTRCQSVDSPRMNSSGKIVFQGLERSCSSPCSFHAASKSRSHRSVDRSYSSGVRVAPVVLNVPVCSRPVFGFFKDKKDHSSTYSAAKDANNSAAARSRSSLGRMTPQRWSGELPRSSGY
jgi:hypothetical protein